MNKILVGLLALSIAANAYLILKPKKMVIEKTQPERELVSDNNIQPEVIIEKDAELESAYISSIEELDMVKAELARVQNELDLLNQRIELAKLDEELKMPTIELDEHGHPKKEVLDKFEDKKDSIKDLYEKEAVDSQWAFATQDKINQTLNEYGDTSLYEIKQLDCKSSVCKVSLNPYSQSSGSGMAAGMNAMMSISKNKDMSGYITSFHFDDANTDSSNNVELFIAKPIKP